MQTRTKLVVCAAFGGAGYLWYKKNRVAIQKARTVYQSMRQVLPKIKSGEWAAMSPEERERVAIEIYMMNASMYIKE